MFGIFHYFFSIFKTSTHSYSLSPSQPQKHTTNPKVPKNHVNYISVDFIEMAAAAASYNQKNLLLILMIHNRVQ